MITCEPAAEDPTTTRPAAGIGLTPARPPRPLRPAILAGVALLLAGTVLSPARGALAGSAAAGSARGDRSSAAGDPAGAHTGDSASAHAGDPASAHAGDPAGAHAGDQVIAQVVKMLRERVSEPVIVLWLEKSGNRPAAVSSDDLVALHKAGASDELMKRLVEAAASGEHPAAAPAAPTAAGPAAAHPAPPAATAPPPPSAAAGTAPAGPAAAAAGAAAPTVNVRFLVTYRPVDVDEGELIAERWLLGIYLDGHFVASVKQGPVALPLPPHAFGSQLAPGRHLLRVIQERHLRYNSARGYKTPSRVDPAELPFELRPGPDAQIVIRFGEKSFRHPGPVSLRVEQGGKEVARIEPAAPNPEAWPTVCEDIPAALPADAKPSGEARRELESCVRWASLWPGLAAVPSREEVRAEIERASQPHPGAS